MQTAEIQLKKAHNRRERKNALIAFSFIAPNFIGFAVLVLIPIIFSFGMSFFDYTGGTIKAFVGLNNYIEMFNNRTFRTSFIHTILFALGVVPVTMVTSLFVAMLLNRPIRWIGGFRALYFFPYITPVVALGAVWNMLFNPDLGFVNTTLSNIFHVSLEALPRWCVSTKWSLITIMLAQIWKSTGYYMVIYLAGLQGIPGELYDAARIDGANGRQSFFRITLPMLSSTTFFVMIMLTINAFQSFELVYLMTEGGPGISSYTLVLHIYKMAFTMNRMGYGCAVSVVLFLMVAIITAIQFIYEHKWVNY